MKREPKFEELWVYNIFERDAGPLRDSKYHFIHVEARADKPVCCMDGYDKNAAAHAKRIIDCVNACAGYEIEEVKAALAILSKCGFDLIPPDKLKQGIETFPGVPEEKQSG